MNERDPALKREHKPKFTDIGELLTSTADNAKELDETAGRKMLQKDTNGYREAVRQRAQLIADLPEALGAFKESGGEVPQDVQDFADSYSLIAQERIDSDNLFGMSVLLTPQGSTIHDPNDLERLAANFQSTE